MQVIFLGFLTFIGQDSRTKAGNSKRVRRGAGLGKDSSELKLGSPRLPLHICGALTQGYSSNILDSFV